MLEVVMLEDVSYVKHGKHGEIKKLKQGETYKLVSNLGCQYGVVLSEDGYIVVPGKAIEVKRGV